MAPRTRSHCLVCGSLLRYRHFQAVGSFYTLTLNHQALKALIDCRRGSNGFDRT